MINEERAGYPSESLTSEKMPAEKQDADKNLWLKIRYWEAVGALKNQLGDLFRSGSPK